MRHQKKGFKLGRTQSHRKATLASMAHALIAHKRITTTRTKARALRMYIEPIITRSKEDTTHNRRQVFRFLQNNKAVSELFDEIAGQVGDRPGGYTRITKLGQRAGDAAEMAIIELVDYNDTRPEGSASGSGKKRTRRGRRGSASTAAAAKPVADAIEEVAEETTAVVEEATEAIAEDVDAAAETPDADAEKGEK
ncbi:MAG: 50S ribosomal protein L17 [Rhodothermales bacterium]